MTQVRIDYDTKEILLHGDRYPIDFETQVNGIELLDTILQVAGKHWASGELLRELFDAIEELCERHFDNNAQGVFCPCGAPTIVDWENRKVDQAKLIKKPTLRT